MASDSKIQIGGGSASLSSMLFIVFLILKLTGAITWSWWWVTCPLWGGLVIILALLAVIGLIALVVAMASSFF